MLTTSQLRQSAALSGVRDIGSIEIDVILTHLLQLFHDHGLTEHLAFKGGTFLRKMVFGPRGRLSTDLDFTCRSDISLDDLTLGLLETLAQPYQGVDFRFDRDKDWYLTDDGCAANPVCAHEGNTTGVKIKIQVSMRERPILPVREMAVLKLWQGGGAGLDFNRFRQRIEAGDEYDVKDLQNLLRKDQKPDLAKMIDQVCSEFRFLGQLTEIEKKLAGDSAM